MAKNYTRFKLLGILCLAICGPVTVHYLAPSSPASHSYPPSNVPPQLPENQIASTEAIAPFIAKQSSKNLIASAVVVIAIAVCAIWYYWYYLHNQGKVQKSEEPAASNDNSTVVSNNLPGGSNVSQLNNLNNNQKPKNKKLGGPSVPHPNKLSNKPPNQPDNNNNQRANTGKNNPLEGRPNAPQLQQPNNKPNQPDNNNNQNANAALSNPSGGYSISQLNKKINNKPQKPNIHNNNNNLKKEMQPKRRKNQQKKPIMNEAEAAEAAIKKIKGIRQTEFEDRDKLEEHRNYLKKCRDISYFNHYYTILDESLYRNSGTFDNDTKITIRTHIDEVIGMVFPKYRKNTGFNALMANLTQLYNSIEVVDNKIDKAKEQPVPEGLAETDLWQKLDSLGKLLENITQPYSCYENSIVTHVGQIMQAVLHFNPPNINLLEDYKTYIKTTLKRYTRQIAKHKEKANPNLMNPYSDVNIQHIEAIIKQLKELKSNPQLNPNSVINNRSTITHHKDPSPPLQDNSSDQSWLMRDDLFPPLQYNGPYNTNLMDDDNHLPPPTKHNTDHDDNPSPHIDGNSAITHNGGQSASRQKPPSNHNLIMDDNNKQLFPPSQHNQSPIKHTGINPNPPSVDGMDESDDDLFSQQNSDNNYEQEQADKPIDLKNPIPSKLKNDPAYRTSYIDAAEKALKNNSSDIQEIINNKDSTKAFLDELGIMIDHLTNTHDTLLSRAQNIENEVKSRAAALQAQHEATVKASLEKQQQLNKEQENKKQQEAQRKREEANNAIMKIAELHAENLYQHIKNLSLCSHIECFYHYKGCLVELIKSIKKENSDDKKTNIYLHINTVAAILNKKNTSDDFETNDPKTKTKTQEINSLSAQIRGLHKILNSNETYKHDMPPKPSADFNHSNNSKKQKTPPPQKVKNQNNNPDPNKRDIDVIDVNDRQLTKITEINQELSQLKNKKKTAKPKSSNNSQKQKTPPPQKVKNHKDNNTAPKKNDKTSKQRQPNKSELSQLKNQNKQKAKPKPSNISKKKKTPSPQTAPKKNDKGFNQNIKSEPYTNKRDIDVIDVNDRQPTQITEINQELSQLENKKKTAKPKPSNNRPKQKTLRSQKVKNHKDNKEPKKNDKTSEQRQPKKPELTQLKDKKKQKAKPKPSNNSQQDNNKQMQHVKQNAKPNPSKAKDDKPYNYELVAERLRNLLKLHSAPSHGGASYTMYYNKADNSFRSVTIKSIEEEENIDIWLIWKYLDDMYRYLRDSENLNEYVILGYQRDMSPFREKIFSKIKNYLQNKKYKKKYTNNQNIGIEPFNYLLNAIDNILEEKAAALQNK